MATAENLDNLPEKSLWREAYTAVLYPKLDQELRVDVVVIGGGITGLTTAYLLQKSGKRVAVIEKDTIGGGTTGRTTGKVSSQHSTIYHDFSERLGEKTARIYGQANQNAVELVEEIIHTEDIPCEWHRQDNYIYTTDPEQIESLKQEADTAAKIGLPSSFVTESPLPFPIVGAVKFTDQARFHSQKYVIGLATTIEKAGGKIFEHSNVVSIRDGSPGSVRTKSGKIIADHIVVATNVPTLPLAARGAYCMLEYPTESYIVAGKPSQPFGGMYISPDKNNYSILPIEHNGQHYTLVGGEGHLSGARLSKESRYEKLAKYAKDKFGIEDIEFKWSDRDYLTYDGPPLAGRIYPWTKNLYVASAFRKWGLSNGTVSAMIIHDLIMGVPNEAAEIYNPLRLRPLRYIPRTAVKLLFN